MTKKIIEHIPLLTVLIIILGVVKLTLFYHNFSVPIKYFLGITEIAITIADDLLFFILIYVVIRAVEIVMKEIKPNFSLIPLFSSKDFSVYFTNSLFLIINLAIIIWIFLEKEYHRKIVAYTYAHFFFLITVMQTKKAKDFFDNNKELRIILYFFAIGLVTVVTMASTEISWVANGKYKGTKITTNDTTYVSTDSSYYLGQTENYIFFYVDQNHYIAIPASTVKRLDMRISNR